MDLKININISGDLLKQVSTEDNDRGKEIKEISIDLQQKKSTLSESEYLYYPHEHFDDEEFCEIYGIPD